MINCPQCGSSMNNDFLDKVMDRLELEMKTNSQLKLEFIFETECCGKSLKAINELYKYYMISEPSKENEEKVFIGAK